VSEGGATGATKGTSAEEVVAVLRHAALQLERTPGAVATAGEEGLRDILLVALNGSLKGQAFGEAFNKRGKTDILVRSDGRNVYLAECKTYPGPAGVSKAVEQLLGYTGWRERHVGLIVFIRRVAMSTAIRSTRKALEDSDGLLSLKTVGEMAATMRHPEDPELELSMSVILVNLPAAVGRDEMVGGEVVGSDDGLADLITLGPIVASGIGYQTHASPAELEIPANPRSVLRLEQIGAKGRVAIDAIPLDEKALSEHVPAGLIEVDEDDAEGKRALRRALKDNVAVEIPDARLRFDRLPPLFGPVVGGAAAANSSDVTLRLEPVGLWQSLMKVSTDRGQLEVPMAFATVDVDGGEEAMRGSFYNLSLILRLRPDENLAFAWEFIGNHAPIREKLASLDLLFALSGEGRVEWKSVDPTLPDLALDLVTVEPDERLTMDRRILGDLVLIEDRLGVEFELPEEIERNDLVAIASAADALRGGTITLRVEQARIPAAEGKIEDGYHVDLLGSIPIDLTIFGARIRLGAGQGSFHGRVEGSERIDGVDHLILVPRDERAALVTVSDLRPPNLP
jgi:hypothetical protein